METAHPNTKDHRSISRGKSVQGTQGGGGILLYARPGHACTWTLHQFETAVRSNQCTSCLTKEETRTKARTHETPHDTDGSVWWQGSWAPAGCSSFGVPSIEEEEHSSVAASSQGDHVVYGLGSPYAGRHERSIVYEADSAAWTTLLLQELVWLRRGLSPCSSSLGLHCPPEMLWTIPT